MAYRTATFDGGAAFQSRSNTSGTGRRIGRAVFSHLALAAGAVVTVGAVGSAVVVAAVWFLGTANVTKPYIPNKMPSGPATLALGYDPLATGGIQPGQATAWTRSQGSRLAGGRPLIVDVPESTTPQWAARPAAIEVARLEPPAPAAARSIIPLPPARAVPAHQELARLPAPQPTPQPAPQVAAQVAGLAPPPAAVSTEKRLALPAIPSAPMGALPDTVSRTAVYDISARTVYLPNGQKMEAHSGLQDKMDDPRFIKVRMRGPTPPNVYVLTERESLFHGVRAIRLNPVDRDRMYGRDGMLAHSYMLGPNGQSNGCVSFKDYDKFLQAFLDGKVDKLVVVADLGNTRWQTAALQADGVSVPARRFASTTSRASRAKRYASFFSEEPGYSPALGFAPTERGAGTW
jgi:hypothetical protein